MRLSLVDNRLPPATMAIIFYYTAHGGNNHQNVEQKLKRLEKSLSEILTLYYPLARRYVKETLSINCKYDGVEYAQALVNGQLSQILQGQFHEIKEPNRFVPHHQEEESATNPLVAVQINIFNCGGLAIGLRTSHRIVDAVTCSLFTNGWAKACKEGHINDVIVPNFEEEKRAKHTPRNDFATDTPVVKLPSPSKTIISEVVTRRFVFDAKTISKVMEAEDNKLKFSTAVVIALIWRAQINAARARNGGFLRPSLPSGAVNLRGKTFRKISENCCGNIYTLGTARFQADESKMRLDNFVDQVRDAITNTIAEFVDFGWGKPAWVSFAQRPYKGVMLIDTKSGDGVEAWVTMDEEEMNYFQNDPTIRISVVDEDGIPERFPIFRSKI
ncbi:hypothetical protein JRO89_XS02G0038400 [Xanthoceras sorbifolium]|uniref:Uncharacterized protein n=1 Tax=Xanthoceras sorbifolium TaxID=99658 RepID=A0ABQ8IEP0_9ROSI|nr:hypothetical protein JRO89_XS02G0038400 [Xanthoceras sorbifolium]